MQYDGVCRAVNPQGSMQGIVAHHNVKVCTAANSGNPFPKSTQLISLRVYQILWQQARYQGLCPETIFGPHLPA